MRTQCLVPLVYTLPYTWLYLSAALAALSQMDVVCFAVLPWIAFYSRLSFVARFFRVLQVVNNWPCFGVPPFVIPVVMGRPRATIGCETEETASWLSQVARQASTPHIYEPVLSRSCSNTAMLFCTRCAMLPSLLCRAACLCSSLEKRGGGRDVERCWHSQLHTPFSTWHIWQLSSIEHVSPKHSALMWL